MSGMKFFVWGGGRWREVSPNGRVAGWGRARFVAAAGGRIRRCRRGAVLRGLRALSAGTPTTVHDGPPLSQIRLQLSKKDGPSHPHDQCHCGATAALPVQASNLALSVEKIFNRLLQSTATAKPQCGDKVDAAVQAGSGATARPRAASVSRRSDRRRQTIDINQNNKEGLKPKQRSKKPEATSQKDSAAPSTRCDTTEAESEVCKELLISEEDVALLRRFVEQEPVPPFSVDLLRFDEDDEYKRQVFFRLNPIVTVSRSRRIQRMLRERRSRTRETNQVSLRDFASVLGLQSVDERTVPDVDGYRTRKRTLMKRKLAEENARDLALDLSDTDKENAVKSRAVPARTPKRDENKAGDKSRASRGTIVRERRTPMRREVKTDNETGRVVNNQQEQAAGGGGGGERGREAAGTKRGAGGGVGGGREYSPLEDAVMVQWVAEGTRARLVNGNRLWRELQPLYHQRTGHFRSWHSLRNRYLRSLLPRLALYVSAAEATRLRAAAATGEIKSRKSRRNSIFNEPRVRSAWSQRRRSPPRRTPSPPAAHSPPRFTPSPPGARSSSASTVLTLPSNDSTTSPPRTHDRSAGEVKRALRSSAVASPQRALRSNMATSPRRAPTPTYSQLTRRYASGSPRLSHTARSPRPVRTSRSKTRRLYNPNQPV